MKRERGRSKVASTFERKSVHAESSINDIFEVRVVRRGVDCDISNGMNYIWRGWPGQ